MLESIYNHESTEYNESIDYPKELSLKDSHY